MKNWLKLHKRTIVRLSVLLAIMIAISAIFLGILIATNVLQFKNGFEFNLELFNSIRYEWWFFLVFLLVQIITTSLLCFVPATSMTFIIASVALFGATWQTFLVCFAGVILSSVAMDFIGRFGGSKIIIKLIGEKEYKGAYDLVQTKGITYIPIMYLLPIFPDDAICMVTGAMKFKFWLHLVYILVCRGIGVATIVFGLNLIPYQDFTTFYEWFVLGAVLIVYVSLLLKVAHLVDKKITEYRSKKEQRNE